MSRSSGLSKPVVGLTGAPGSGKSAVARLLSEHGALVIDADQLARDAMADPQVIEQLTAWWGQGILQNSGQINRQAVASIVFTDDSELRRLEGVIHPRVDVARQRLRLEALADASIGMIVEDCPLLLETSLDRTCDWVVYVQAPRDVRLERLRATRGWSQEELRRREARQCSPEARRQQADHVIDNGGNPDELAQQVARLARQCIDASCGR